MLAQTQSLVSAAVPPPTNADAVTAAAGEFLAFKLGAEEYGIDILRVQEIRSFEVATRIANAPAHVLGVLNLRGVIVPIVDLRLKFDLNDARYTELTVVIVLNVSNRVVAIVVDSVSDVLALSAEQIKPAPTFNSVVDASYINGMGSVKSGANERMLILVDIKQLMSGADMGLVDAQVH